MKKKAAAVVAIEPTPPPPPASPEPAPRVLIVGEPTAPAVAAAVARIRRDTTGRIVEYERHAAPILVNRFGDVPGAAPPPPPPRTLAALNDQRRARMTEIEAAAGARRQQIRIESSRVAGPIIAERDKLVQEARRVLDNQRSRLRKEEEETIARITREARAKFKQLGDEIQAAYDQGKQDAHANARTRLDTHAERPMQDALATIEAEVEAARVDVIAWCTEQEAAIREAEKAAAAVAGATLGALAPAAAAPPA